MKIKATIKLEYSINDSEITKFKSKVVDYIQEKIDEDYQITPDDISNEAVEEFLSDTLPDIIEELHKGYAYNGGIEIDNYFGTICFDYYGEDARDLVRDMAYQIYDKEEKIK